MRGAWSRNPVTFSGIGCLSCHGGRRGTCSAICAIENHSPLIKFLNLIFGVGWGGNYLHVDTIPAWKPFLILGLMCSQNLYLCPLFLLSLQSEGLILPQFPISVTGPFSPEEGKEAGPAFWVVFLAGIKPRQFFCNWHCKPIVFKRSRGPAAQAGSSGGDHLAELLGILKTGQPRRGFVFKLLFLSVPDEMLCLLNICCPCSCPLRFQE